ncbi:MAG: glutamyl-tRNA reductase [Bacteroidota bacterium]|nr:glutamyl-tRNA reductase [Bacteroidota bacterium]
MNFTNDFNSSLQNFSIVGINYRKSDISIRGKFSISPEQSVKLIQEAISKKVQGCLVLSTCNRTELYGICNDPKELTELLCSYTNGDRKDFESQGYVYNGRAAVEHLLNVASGLDSQIIGDYEILSQLKHSARLAKESGGLNPFMERVINFALQASKEIKTKTKLSSGSVSVSYAAIQIIKEKIKDLKNKKVLLVGTGKFGNQIAKNLKDYLPGASISFCNRTDEKAYLLAEKYDEGFVAYKNLASACNEADVIMISSSSENHIVLPSYFVSEKPRLVLDLSSPQNADPAIKQIHGITLMDVDEVSLILDETISAREAEVPKALKIINDTLNDLEDWHRQQANSPLIQKVKSQLLEINEAFEIEEDKEKIHKTVASLAIQLKHSVSKGCECINVLSSYVEKNLVLVH